ncbi:MAG: sugar phosphate nucleotidyltransferase [bacterium]|nr:sugar phosphate nucleotidyltransferase [bacterium]
MKAVIMAGGLGKRLKPFTQIIPKPLLPVGEKSILEITIHKLKEQGFTEVILAVYYRSDLFESYFGDGSKFGLKIRYTKEKERLGTAGPLKLATEFLEEPFLVANGDILVNMKFTELREFHLANDADFTLVTKTIQMPLHYGVVEKKENRIQSIKEKPVVEAEVSAGIYFMSPDVLDYIPANQAFPMTDLMRALIADKRSVLAYPLEGYWLDIGQLSDYERAQDDVTKGLI